MAIRAITLVPIFPSLKFQSLACTQEGAGYSKGFIANPVSGHSRSSGQHVYVLIGSVEQHSTVVLGEHFAIVEVPAFLVIHVVAFTRNYNRSATVFTG